VNISIVFTLVYLIGAHRHCLICQEAGPGRNSAAATTTLPRPVWPSTDARARGKGHVLRHSDRHTRSWKVRATASRSIALVRSDIFNSRGRVKFQLAPSLAEKKLDGREVSLIDIDVSLEFRSGMIC
jgi:hypothetical protein